MNLYSRISLATHPNREGREMGTNYYLVTDVCECCRRGADRKHIGKSSAGWCFALRVYPDKWDEPKILNLAAWQLEWSQPKSKIEDEYGRTVTPEEMLDIIINRGRKDPLGWTQLELGQNHAEQGPNNLARSTVDGRHCIGHGDGPFDLISGEFS